MEHYHIKTVTSHSIYHIKHIIYVTTIVHEVRRNDLEMNGKTETLRRK